MGEGERDRFGKRQKSAYRIDKSSSDTELARGKNKGRKPKVKEKWPFVEGLTVDELARFRRKKVQDQPKDTLGVCQPEDVIDGIVTEYRRAFCASSDDIFKISKENLSPTRSKRSEDYLRTDDSLIPNEPLENQNQLESNSKKPEELPTNLTLTDGQAIMETEINPSRCITNSKLVRKPSPKKRATKLKREGDIYNETEYSQFVPHEGFHKPDLLRRPTSLKLEGEMQTMTEKCEKFIEWLNVSRPELIKLPNNLKLEGDFETTTESHDSYVPFVGVRRPEILRQCSQLKLEGEASFFPEYSEVFKNYDLRGRRGLKKPETHLRTGGDFYQTTEASQQFLSPRSREAKLMNDLVKDLEDEEEKKKKEAEDREEEDEIKRKKEEEMKMLVSKLEDLKGPPLGIAEYTAAYKVFPRERPKLMKPEDEIGRADGSKISSSPVHIKFASKIDQDPEYKSKYLDSSHDRPVYRKPPLTLKPALVSSSRASANASRMSFQESRRHEQELKSEVKSQYVPYGQIPRVETVRMPTNLHLEGNLDLNPEYKNAYCSKRESLVSNEPRMHRHRQRNISASKNKDNYWRNNNNSEQFGRINAADDQDAFQILSTRVHEESIVGKPPTGSRRGSRSSITQRPSVDAGDRSILRNRSPSPTFRLHVTNVDDEPRGFVRRRRSSSVQSSEKIRTTHDVEDTDESQRPYSPSFAKEIRGYSANGQAFVVLDNGVNETPKINNNNLNEKRRRRTDSNFSVESSLPIRTSRTRNKTPPNWMPTWYESSSSSTGKIE
ncbi:uncharacterized protein LOC117182751 [Belonocnema kinseyi]|uniref:uncharacterized protein LOC117182751 n=1 Tax=Belonocnema kinseyi TaxID=2817044 RepID=UPI00143DC408|nr:uncharacterized protein LOC117182751 [Belonocnema kinseyi]